MGHVGVFCGHKTCNRKLNASVNLNLFTLFYADDAASQNQSVKNDLYYSKKNKNIKNTPKKKKKLKS